MENNRPYFTSGRLDKKSVKLNDRIIEENKKKFLEERNIKFKDLKRAMERHQYYPTIIVGVGEEVEIKL
jgi:hypothetical protein